MANEYLQGLSTRLFGAPYQFTAVVDPRMKTVSSKLGVRYAKNIMAEAPVLTILPGRSQYLPGKSKNQKYSATTAFVDAAMGDTDSTLRELISQNSLGKDWRLYDFQLAYSEYMDYVNMLCRAGAMYLDLPESFTIPAAGGKNVVAQQYDWRDWHWSNAPGTSKSTKSYSNVDAKSLGFDLDKGKSLLDYVSKSSKKGKNNKTGKKGNKNSNKTDTDKGNSSKSDKSGKKKTNYAKAARKKLKATGKEAMDSLRSLYTNYNYVQFYIDPDIGHSDSFSNSTSESAISGLVGSASSTSKELQFLTSGLGISEQGDKNIIRKSVQSISDSVEGLMDSQNSSVLNVIKRVVNLGGQAVVGNNVIMPEVYQSSSSPRNYDITIHLKTPYGNRFSYYMDIYVPMCHLLALVLPRQATANSYSEPFLVKAYVDAMLSVSLGIVEDVTITKATDTLTVDGLPTEVDITLSIKDLYSDLMMNSSREPILFINNTNLVQYLGTACGMSLVNPNMATKYKLLTNSVIKKFTESTTSIKGAIDDGIYNAAFNTVNGASKWLPAATVKFFR